MALRELVEQATLHVRARQVVEFLLLLVADQALQLVEVLEPEHWREFVVDLGLAGGLDGLDDDVERRVLALQIGGLVIGREGHVERFLSPFLTRPSGPRSRGSGCPNRSRRHVLAGAAVEGDAADLADEVDHDLVAARRGMALGGIVIACLRLRQLGNLRIDRGFVGSTVRRSSLSLSIAGVGTCGRVSSVT